jgi:hypothetical protein
MLAAFIEAALRSLILALAVWTGLRIFRIHNVFSQRLAWTIVLLGSLLMPFALPFTAQWHVLSFATIPAPASLDQLRSALAPASSTASHAASPSHAANPVIDSALVPTSQFPPRNPEARKPSASHTLVRTGFEPAEIAPVLNPAPVAGSGPKTPTTRPQISIVNLCVLAYFFIAAVLLARLLFGLVSAMHLWHTSTPIPPVTDVPFGADLNLRWSRKVSAPVTIASGIVLPAGYKSWTEETIRIVLAHERSHVNHHDFHLQMLASLYAAVAWFSPLGWWLKHKLSDLGEALSDRSGLNAASNRSAYAQVLLEFAAAPRTTHLGVAMARPSSISRRIERLLNDSYLIRAFSGSIRARFAVVVVPVVLFAGAALVHVQAATQASENPPIAIAATAVFPALPVPPTSPSTQAAPAPPMWSATPGSPAVPAPPALPDSPASLAVPAHPAPPELALAAPPAPPAPPAGLQNGEAESEATFDRNLSFSGKLDLSVGTASGNITLTRGSAGQIHIHGIVKANHDADPAQVQQIAANPPIEQQGNAIRIGGHDEHTQQNIRGISVSYEIEAPADTGLSAATGSGNITDTGVGQDAKLITGSGNINATGMEGGFNIQTGSGNIAIEGSGQGDAKARTGSGNIDLKGVAGALQAQTGSGRIKAEGKPSSAWKLQTGSGSIELATDNAPINLDASTGSGRIAANQSSAMETSGDHHHMHGPVNGGGPEVKVETGSGDIHVD